MRPETSLSTGVAIGSRSDASNEEIISLARLAEELGYDTIWVGESWGRDAFTLLSMIACHTTRIRLGTGIVSVFSRSPALIAQSIASLDIISEGRAVLGLGTSGRAVIEQWHGHRFESPLERTREYIHIIRLALSGQRVDHQGRFFSLRGFHMPFSPIRERIPIYVAALGPRNLALTGELADGWLPVWVDLQHLPAMSGQVEESAVRAGRSMADITVAPQVLATVAFDEEQRREATSILRNHMAYYIGGMGSYYYQLFRRYGYEEEASRIREAWRQKDRARAAALITSPMLDNVTIYGDPDECRRRLARYRAAGADMPVVAFPHGATRASIRATMEALSPVG